MHGPGPTPCASTPTASSILILTRRLAEIAWVPFGRGTRNCIGFALAQMELTLIIARLAQRLDITATSAEVPQPVGMVVNRPSGGAPMLVRERSPAARRPGHVRSS